MADATLELLSRLIATNSVNPAFGGPESPGPGEAMAATIVAAALRASGLAVELQEVAPGRSNVIGVLEGKKPGSTLLLCGHLDTVGVSGMAQPFVPEERDGRMYGRGAQDMKGGLAAMVGAAQRLAQTGGLERGRLIVAGVIDEEFESIGAVALAESCRADAAIIPESTDLALGLGHQGFTWLEVTTVGRAAHGSRPREGRDAILDMGRVLQRVEALNQDLLSRAPHPLLGHASVHASLIQGGHELSSYPDRCVMTLERRTRTDEPERGPQEEIEGILDELRAADKEFAGTVRLVLARQPSAIPAEHPLVAQLSSILSGRGVPVRTIGTSFWTDAAILGQAGIPTVLFGPSGGGLHSPGEYVEMATVLTCREVLAAVAASFCALPGPRDRSLSA